MIELTVRPTDKGSKSKKEAGVSERLTVSKGVKTAKRQSISR